MSDKPDNQILFEQLTEHAQAMSSIHMRDLFMHDPNRGKKLTLQAPEIFIDYSKNVITSESLHLLLEYTNALNIKASIDAMFDGEKINITENRAVLHTALRSASEQQLKVDGENIINAVHEELDKLDDFVSAIHNAHYLGWTGKPFDTFVNIGIGGSDLGPKMVIDALEEYRLGETQSFFISNIDYQQIHRLKKTINPETTLFIISSKSFSTIETKTNADSIKSWLLELGCQSLEKHFVAITANETAALNYGISKDRCLKIWDWVGGRFSLWSAIGLPIALAIGFDNFKALLTGAREMDQHFQQVPFEKNAPVILALIDYWYNNFFDAETHAFIPYDESLRYFPEFLSQLFMESNGKSSNLSGHVVDYKTMPVTWGSAGTNAQHAFFQLLHQGTHRIPIDFLVPLKKTGEQTHHALLFANCLAQSQALMQGEDNPDPHRYFEGNKPSTTILYNELNPKTLGALIALFEHRTFVQGLLWQINSFDQWGVELGKKLAHTIYSAMDGKNKNDDFDSSTLSLIEQYRNAR